MQPNDTTLPSVTLKLTNLSYKQVIAIGVNLLVGEKVSWTALPRGHDGGNLIEAGGMYDLFADTAEDSPSDPKGNTSVSVPDRKILITAVLFRDGMFEGAPEVAVQAAAFNLGAKIMLGKLLPLLDRALAADDNNPAAVLEQLRSEISALTSDVNPKVAKELAGKFPALGTEAANRVKHLIDVGSNGVKTELLKRLDSDSSVEPKQSGKEPFGTMLSRIRDGIKEWQDRL
jgi:hypothetical protein